MVVACLVEMKGRREVRLDKLSGMDRSARRFINVREGVVYCVDHCVKV